MYVHVYPHPQCHGIVTRCNNDHYLSRWSTLYLHVSCNIHHPHPFSFLPYVSPLHGVVEPLHSLLFGGHDLPLRSIWDMPKDSRLVVDNRVIFKVSLEYVVTAMDTLVLYQTLQ